MADQMTAYHIELGPAVMLTTDAKSAIANHPAEWSEEPWAPEERRAWVAQKWERDCAQAKAEGRPQPPQPEDPVLTEEQAAAEAEYQDKLKEARLIVAEDDRIRREKADYDAQVAAARAFLAQPAPLQYEPERVSTRPVEGEGPPEIPEDWRDRTN